MFVSARILPTHCRLAPRTTHAARSIHTLGSRVEATAHPDSRAIMYETETYSRRKINDLLQALRAFETADRVRDAFHDPATGELLPGVAASPLLARTLHDRFPPLRPLLAFFKRAFDADEAKSKGTITPAPGVDPRYDAALAEVKATNGG